MVSLLYLKLAFNESDEDVVLRWGETPTWQYFFSGQEYSEQSLPCAPTLLVKFRKLLGEEGVEELLACTIEVVDSLKLIAKKELSRVIVDSTVQEKTFAHPTDRKLLETARVNLVEAAKAQGIELKRTLDKGGQLLGYKAGRYVHPRQFKRMSKVFIRQCTIVSCLRREITRKMNPMSQAVHEALSHTMKKAKRFITQTRSHKSKDKTKDKQPKLYSWQAPEVECISKGKSRNPYEFGVSMGIATTLKGTLIVGARSFPCDPYDGHILNEQFEQASILMQATGVTPQTAIVDLGYLGVDKDNQNLSFKHRGKFKSMTEHERNLLKRRQAIEPIICYLKADYRMNRCELKCLGGDNLHEVLCAAGYNIRWLLRMIAKKGVWLLLRLINAFGFKN